MSALNPPFVHPNYIAGTRRGKKTVDAEQVVCKTLHIQCRHFIIELVKKIFQILGPGG
jgi:hypothetical protein